MTERASRLKPGQRETVGFNELFGETVERLEHGSEHVTPVSLSGSRRDGARDRGVMTITTKSGREFVISQCMGELVLSEVGQPARVIKLTWQPTSNKRLGAVNALTRDGTASAISDQPMTLSAARKRASELCVKLEILP